MKVPGDRNFPRGGRFSLAARRLAPLSVLLLLTLTARAADTQRKTNEVLTSVAGIARNLELADVPSPIDISADRLEFDYGKGLLKYEGNVHVDHAGAKIHARTLEVSFEPEGRRSLKKIVARGSVEVLHGDESARGELAEYDPTAATIVLSRNARLGSGPNSLTGEKVLVYLNERRALVLGGDAAPVAGTGDPAAPVSTGKGRIRAVIMPDSLEKKDRPKK